MKNALYTILALLVVSMPVFAYAEKSDAVDEVEAKKGTIAIILTSHDKMGYLHEKTGFWYEEMAAPYYVFSDAGYEVILSSVQGGEVNADPRSIDKDVKAVARFMDDEAAVAKLENTVDVGSLEADSLDGVFLAGGHGTMWDFPGNQDLRELVTAMDSKAGAIGAVCHGPAAFVHMTDDAGNAWLKGRRVTGFTNEEEVAVGFSDVVPFLLETKMRDAGGLFTKRENFSPYVVRDGNLVTGQNPASSAKAAQLVLRVLKDKAAAEQ